MDRRTFVGALGAAGAASLLPLDNDLLALEKIERHSDSRRLSSTGVRVATSTGQPGRSVSCWTATE